jgi:signal transduction histidine kinase
VTLADLPVRNGDGEIVGLMHLEQDMTEMGTLQQRLIQSRNELRLAQAQSARQNRDLAARSAELTEANAQLEAFGHTISHDLRAPLQSIEGYAEMLLRQSGAWKDTGAQDDLRHIVEAVERMSKMIQELLALSRLRRVELTLQPTPLLAVVQDALAEVDADVRERQAQVLVEEPLPTVMGQHATLVQVVANLVTNAVKFVAPHVVPRVRIWGEEHDRQVRLWVQDNGIGIAAADRERIFRAFERLQGVETYAGSGIGLAIVHTAVQRLGGRVRVESEVGQGSRFCVELQGAGTASAQLNAGQSCGNQA